MFEEVPIEPQVSEFAQKLKDAWENADFTEIGSIVASKVNGALESIPWGKIQGTCNKIAKSIATFLNGFIKNANWPLVGQTISEGVNTAFETANTFAQNFSWKSLGTAVGNGINGALHGLNWTTIRSAVKNIASGVVDSINSLMRSADWDKIGNTITRFLSTKLLALYTAINTFSWSDFGKSFGDLINGAIDGIDADMLADTLSGALNGLAEALHNFDKTIKWGELSEKLYKGINRFLRLTNWSELGASLASLMTHLLGEITDTIEGTDWDEVGRSIGEFLTGINWKEVLGQVADAIKATAKALPQVALGIIDAIKDGISDMTVGDWLDVAESLFTILASALAIKALIHGPKIAAAMLGNAVKNAFSQPANELGESVAEKAFGGFKAKWSTLLKAGVAVGIVAGITQASTITTSNYDTAYPEDISGVAIRYGTEKEKPGDLDKLKAKVDELKASLEMLSDAGKENTEDFKGMSNWLDRIEAKIAGVDYTTYVYSKTLEDVPNEVSTDVKLHTQQALANANGYETSLVGIPSSIATTVTADTSEATKKVNIFKSLADKLGLTKYKTYFEAVTDRARENVKALTGETNLAAGLKKIMFEAETDDADNRIENTGDKVDDVKAKSKFSLDVDTSEASSGLDLFTTLKLLVMRALLNMKLSLDTKAAMESLDAFHEKLSEVVGEKSIKFTADISDFRKISGTMYSLGQDSAKSFKNGLKSVHIPTPHMYVSSWTSHSLGSGGYSYTPNYSVQWYREGGPVSGEIWGMNEAGNPEMIGTVGNKTAVANNEMITEAIKGAVVDGMMEVFLATRAGNSSNEEAPTVEVVVKADDETLYRRVMKGKKKAERRYQVVTST